jgi:vacuolar-type H+-ATPase subunit H
MENKNTLDHLLKIEAEAAALVNDAQTEADRRIRENEEKNRAAHEERFKVEVKAREEALTKEEEEFRKQYRDALEKYRGEISGVNVDVPRFSALFNEFLAGEN